MVYNYCSGKNRGNHSILQACWLGDIPITPKSLYSSNVEEMLTDMFERDICMYGLAQMSWFGVYDWEKPEPNPEPRMPRRKRPFISSPWGC